MLAKMLAWASRNNNAMPYNSDVISEEIGASSPVDLERLVASGMFEVFDSRLECVAEEQVRVSSLKDASKNASANASKSASGNASIRDQRSEFRDSEGKEERPYMLHRALLGSFERFIGLLIENYGGAFPVWLAPEQVKILAISDRHADYVNSLRDKMAAAGLRVEVDLDNETLGNKIRKATAYKIPYIAIVGDKEMENNKINVRIRGQKEPQDFDIDEFINRVVDEDKRKVIN